jgi:predicted cytidylate kinase
MPTPRTITLAGDVGSGKSTVGTRIAERLGLPYVSTGQLQRRIARDRGLTTLELNRQSMLDRAVDDTIDSRLVAIETSGEDAVIDARLGWFFIPRSFKVFLSVDPREGARRTFSARRPEERSASEEVAMRENIARRQLENERFKSLYGARCGDVASYDLLVDTTHVPPSTVVDAVLSAHAAHAAGAAERQCLVSPKRLLPTRAAADPADRTSADIEDRIRRRGFDPDSAVRVVATDLFFILYDGHRRTSAALRLGLALVPCATLSLDGQYEGVSLRQFVRDNLQRRRLHDWEAVHGFRFLSYPDADLGVDPEPDAPGED